MGRSTSKFALQPAHERPWNPLAPGDGAGERRRGVPDRRALLAHPRASRSRPRERAAHGRGRRHPRDRALRERRSLRRQRVMQVPVTLARELGLDRPVFMGSSIGGHLAADLALNYPDIFRAVVGLEAAAYTPGGYLDVFYHPRISNDFKASVMFGLMSPTSPEPLRRETAWVYSQGAPPVLKGDLYYFSVDHDLRATARDIDTSRVAVYLLTGEYDWAATPAMSRELAEQIPGASYRTMEGLGHFPMSEDPERFLGYVRPVLAEISARGR